MKIRLTTIVPVFNAKDFILQTLQSVASQTRRPDRVIVIDNCSTDNTKELIFQFKDLQCEWHQNATNLGLFGNCNRALQWSEETEYLHLLHADDLIEPSFYETQMSLLDDCGGYGLAYCLDERIDDDNKHLSLSGPVTGKTRLLSTDAYLKERAEIGNQAFCATLLKTSYQKAPCLFRMDMPMLADMVFWADWGRHCRKIVHLAVPLAKYRWHGANTTTGLVPELQTIVLDEWKTMEIIEGWRAEVSSPLRWWKLKGLFAVRAGIKAKRFREQGNRSYSRQIARSAQRISGWRLWIPAQILVHSRDLLVYGLLGRRKHPKNVFG